MFIPTLLRVEFIKSSHIAALGSRAPSLREQWPRRESASQGRQNPSDDLGLIEPLIGKPSLTVLWKVLPVIRPHLGANFSEVTYGHSLRRAQSRVVFGAGQPKLDYKFAPKASRRPSQSFTTNSRECHGVFASARVNSTPRAAYSAYSASASSTNRYASSSSSSYFSGFAVGGSAQRKWIRCSSRVTMA